MYKKYFATILFSIFTVVMAQAADVVFSSNDTEQFQLQPLNVETKSPVKGAFKEQAQIKTYDSGLSDKNFLKAIGNLDTAQVDLREQLQNYANLMIQSKTAYLGKKEEYRAYKKQYNAVKRKINRIEKSKKIIQDNVVNNIAN